MTFTTSGDIYQITSCCKSLKEISPRRHFSITTFLPATFLLATYHSEKPCAKLNWKKDFLFSNSLVNLAGQLAKSFSAALVLTFLTVRFSLILISSLHFRSKISGATFLLFQNSELGSQVTVITQVDRLVCFSLGLLG